MSDGLRTEIPVIIPAIVEIPATAALPLASAIEPRTTEEEQKITAGQRKINLVWEFTQSFIAVTVTVTMLTVTVILVIKGEYDKAIQLMAAAFFLIIGFYFGRTNHQRIGGIGTSKYEGR